MQFNHVSWQYILESIVILFINWVLFLHVGLLPSISFPSFSFPSFSFPSISFPSFSFPPFSFPSTGMISMSTTQDIFMTPSSSMGMSCFFFHNSVDVIMHV